MATTPTAGTFQSLAQLAVALNAAFASLTTFFGNDYTTEERRVRAALAFISRNKNIALGFTDIQNENMTELRLLSGKIMHLRRKHDIFIEYVARPASIVGVVVGFLYLIYTTFYSEDAITRRDSIIIVLCNAPFITGIIGTALMSAYLWYAVIRKRETIEKRYKGQGGI